MRVAAINESIRNIMMTYMFVSDIKMICFAQYLIYRELDFEDVFNIVDKLYCTNDECLKEKRIEYI